jgi:hypothetical protein
MAVFLAKVVAQTGAEVIDHPTGEDDFCLILSAMTPGDALGLSQFTQAKHDNQTLLA